jgi:hypothetical protein
MWPFKKQEEEKVVEPEDFLEDENYARITFIVENGKTNVEFDWKCQPEDDTDLAIEFGALLSDLNSGKYTKEIVSILDEYMKGNPEGRQFVEDVILVWKETNDLMKEHSELLLDEPLVQPLKVFRQSSIFRE